MKESRSTDDSFFAQLIEAVIPEIRDAVRHAYLFHKHKADKEEIEDICQQILLLLMEDEYRRLRTFEQKSSLKTWLNVVVRHYLNRHLNSNRREESLEEIAPDSLMFQANQENLTIYNEKLKVIQEAISKLTGRERQLFELLCKGDLSNAEIANYMGIKVASVHRRKHTLVKKIQLIIADSGRATEKK